MRLDHLLSREYSGGNEAMRTRSIRSETQEAEAEGGELRRRSGKDRERRTRKSGEKRKEPRSVGRAKERRGNKTVGPGNREERLSKEACIVFKAPGGAASGSPSPAEGEGESGMHLDNCTAKARRFERRPVAEDNE